MKLFLSTWSRAPCTQIDLFGFVFFFQRLKLITFGENLLISEVINFRKIQIAKRKKKPVSIFPWFIWLMWKWRWTSKVLCYTNLWPQLIVFFFLSICCEFYNRIYWLTFNYVLIWLHFIEFQWTTDQDLIDSLAAIGVTDLVEIKFYENRANGQSKG